MKEEEIANVLQQLMYDRVEFSIRYGSGMRVARLTATHPTASAIQAIKNLKPFVTSESFTEFVADIALI